MTEFTHITQTLEPKKKERVKSVTVRIFIKDATGIVRITDIMVQSGAATTGWVGNVGEMPFTLEG